MGRVTKLEYKVLQLGVSHCLAELGELVLLARNQQVASSSAYHQAPASQKSSNK